MAQDTDAEQETFARRERKSVEQPQGTVYEAGRDKRFIASPAGTVHERAKLKGGGHRLDPKCGTRLGESSLWGGIDAEDAEEVARRYGMTRFCSECFSRSLKLERIGWEARQ